MRFEIIVLKSLTEVVRIKGEKIIGENELTKEEVESVIHIETLLEKLTGFRFHINQMGR